MNTPKAIELAFAELVRRHAELGKDTLIRAWQSLAVDGSWEETKDRDFPLVDIRCAPPRTEQTQSTMAVDAALLCGTKGDDDRDHAIISALYEAVESVCNRLFAQFMTLAGTAPNQAEHPELFTFLAKLDELLSPASFHFGGLAFGTPQPPFNENGVQMIGITMVVHYGRPDC